MCILLNCKYIGPHSLPLIYQSCVQESWCEKTHVGYMKISCMGTTQRVLINAAAETDRH